MSKPTPEEFQIFSEYDLYPTGNTIYLPSKLTGEESETGIDALAFERVMKGLLILKDEENVDIILNTAGGDVYHGFGIYDLIANHPGQVTVKCFGRVMSMGSIILQAADNRQMSENATMLIHYGTDAFIGHTKDAERAARESQRVCKLMEDILLSKIKGKNKRFTRSKLQEMMKFDTYLTAEEALKLGLIDEII